MNWVSALAWVEQKNAEAYLGYDDWRLPNAKELQSVADYTRSPATTNGHVVSNPLVDHLHATRPPLWPAGQIRMM